MFFTDPRQAVRAMLRVLASRGHLTVTAWDSGDNIPASASAAALLERLAGQQAAAALRAPFVLGNRTELAAFFADAGATAAEITTHHGAARFPDTRTMVEADLWGWLPVLGVHLSVEQSGRILQEAERALSAYVTVNGLVTFQLSAHLVTAQK